MIAYHREVIQGGVEWHTLRCGILTASEVRLIITPTLRPASNERERSHLYELLSQRITGYVEPRYISDDMMRGQDDEIEARIKYAEHYAPVCECGFVANDDYGPTIGYSPDGLVGEDGLIECKSRRQKYQTETIVRGEMPDEYMLQIQTGLLVSGRAWCDFVSFCAGMPMFVDRIFPDSRIREAIIEAAIAFEDRLNAAHLRYMENIRNFPVLINTERTIEQEIYA